MLRFLLLVFLGNYLGGDGEVRVGKVVLVWLLRRHTGQARLVTIII